MIVPILRQVPSNNITWQWKISPLDRWLYIPFAKFSPWKIVFSSKPRFFPYFSCIIKITINDQFHPISTDFQVHVTISRLVHYPFHSSHRVPSLVPSRGKLARSGGRSSSSISRWIFLSWITRRKSSCSGKTVGKTIGTPWPCSLRGPFSLMIWPTFAVKLAKGNCRYPLVI